jgi:OPA family glycerol-3-phosphate transporter-like MFS transporter
MKKTFSPFARRMAYLFAAVYFASYVMRTNFAVLIVSIGAQMGLEKSALAIVITGLTVAYGTGQILCGVLGDRIKPQLMITVGLSVALLCNVSIAFCQSIAMMTVVWTVNGLAHAMLWPPIVKMLALYLDDAAYSYAVVRVSCGSSVATICLYALCPVLLSFTDWRGIVLICAAVGGGVLLLWLVASARLMGGEKPVKDSDGGEVPVSAAPEAQSVPLPKATWLPLVLVMLGVVAQGMLRDGVTNWMPSYLLESFGLGEEKAIFSTVILAVFSMISFCVFDVIHRKVFKNEVFCSAVIFAAAVLCSLGLYMLNLFSASVVASMLLMGLLVACMHGINLMLIGVVPKRLVKSGRVSTFSGIINACTYVGASISTYGFARIAESFGWNATVLSWALVSIFGLAVCLAAFPLWKKFRREYADAPQDET